ncbi:phage/plasmid-associated DNA primase [Streptomyces candidus]|uniref:Phage/plasmid-associated DNA primase n=1 Tax=Streptomyces candidus TaxID=67283 RepID=A0A7X0HL62_9ACTN|nr:phage/plasmid-associated DNA primase [Streptomyces candidus]GHH45827.1 hypothetical protein GCM10018773_36040 [Streptomyces candidus]
MANPIKTVILHRTRRVHRTPRAAHRGLLRAQAQRHLQQARVKLLTGGDRITARRLRQDFFNVTPTHKPWLLGDDRPEVGTGGHAFWRRMRIIPFERQVPDAGKIVATAAYQTTEDHVGCFLQECCLQGDSTDLRVEQEVLYETYGRWCAEEGIRASPNRAFASRIRQELGLVSPADMVKNNATKFYPRLALLNLTTHEPLPSDAR